MTTNRWPASQQNKAVPLKRKNHILYEEDVEFLMADVKKTKYILHVSDFHLKTENLEFAKEGLKCLSNMLDKNDITVDYLIHTGDVIDSKGAICIAVSDICKADPSLSWIAEKYIPGACFDEDGILSYPFNASFDENGFLTDPNTTEELLQRINNQITTNMEMAYSLVGSEIIGEFLADIRVRRKHTYFCVGNHDTLRPITKDTPQKCDRFQHDYGDAADYHRCLEEYERKYKVFSPYSESLLKQLDVGNSDLQAYSDRTADLNLVILNTNHRNPYRSKEGYYCIDCANITRVLNEFNTREDDRHLNVVIAHKPIYEICEAARMAFSSYHKTEFMTAIQNFLGNDGLYICGDKHTRSVSDTTFHSVQHIIGGAPFKKSNEEDLFHVEYNLVEVIGGEVGHIQKIHLSHDFSKKSWQCVFRPEDRVVERLYELSSNSVIPQCLSVLSLDSRKNSWTDISRIFYKDKRNDPKWIVLEQKLDKLYRIICKYDKIGPEVKVDVNHLHNWYIGKVDNSIFQNMRDYLIHKISNFDQANILNIRGEYSSGKSTFLGILYIYLLYQYSIGNISFIPAYFNLENKEILKQINCNNDKILYYKAATESFKKFANEVQSIADKSHQRICFLIDGLDEQDVWSYSSEDSVGRGILDVLDGVPNAKNIMSYSQHHLPLFKNTMPERKYKDYSDVMYFNNVNVVSADSKKGHFKQFISAFYSLKTEQTIPNEKHKESTTEPYSLEKIEKICSLIRKFRRLSVSQSFLYKFAGYIEEKIKVTDSIDNLSIDEVYRNYIDLLHKMCFDVLGYGYVHYAPAMAYLFTFKGFTYERFKNIPPNTEDFWQSKIAEHSDKVYDAFIFIKKNQDIREYLVAMHYNRDLRYYAENPEMAISDASILNEFIPRNIAIISRKMWKSDPNKFVIVCVALLEKRCELGQNPISNCALSMLLYTLAHQAKMYAPSNKMLDRIFSSYETDTGKISDTPNEGFSYKQQDTDLLQQFLNYGLHRTYRLYKAVSEGNSEELAISMKNDENFARYNRQYLRLYYGDLTISGENRKAALVPGDDICLKGFDFHNTFNHISEKLRNIEKDPYALMAFDLYSLCDLIDNRLDVARTEAISKSASTFFSGKKNGGTQIGVLCAAVDFIDAYLRIKPSHEKDEYLEKMLNYKSIFTKAIDIRNQQVEASSKTLLESGEGKSTSTEK